MSDFNVGDIFTFRLNDELFGMGRIIRIENLSQFDRMHVQIYDAILAAGPGGINEHGEPFERSHDLTELADPAVLVDHLCLDLDFFLASDPMVVDYSEVDADDLLGYRVWLQVQHDHMVRLGMLGSRSEEEADVSETGDAEEDDAGDFEGEEDEYDGEEGSDDEFVDATAGIDADDADVDSENEERVTVRVRPWHQIILREPLGAGLTRLHEEFADEDLRATMLGGYLTGLYSAENTEEIAALVDALLEGDFGAGQELMEFGDAAVKPLSEHLESGSLDAQQTEDVMNILTDIATPGAYEAIATHFERYRDRLDSAIGHGIARAFCYAVMLTGGAPEPLRRLLPQLDSIDHPDLREDVASARTAVMNAGPPDREDPESAGTSSSPFGTLGV